jgi:hypothetical protein
VAMETGLLELLYALTDSALQSITVSQLRIPGTDDAQQELSTLSAV